MNAKRNLILASVGAAFEYYDFAVYALLAPYISKAFFPISDHYTALMETFIIFATGYIARPIGGIIFGMLGDKVGRKKIFVISMFMMAVSTLVMGFLPTYQTWGRASSIILLIARIIQGFSFGAEMPGAVTFLSEHSKKQLRGTNCGIMVSSVGLGVAFGSLVTYLLNLSMSTHNIYDWGWRIPFFIGGTLAIVAYLLRAHSQETPQFLKMTPVKNSLVELFQYHKQKIILSIGIVLFPASFMVFFLSIPSYLKDVFHYSYNHTYLVMTLGYLWSSMILPVLGYVSDKIGRRILLLVSVAFFIITAFPMFSMLKNYNILSLVLFALLCQTIIAAMAASYFALLAEIFPTCVRFTGVALCYNLAYVLASGVPVASNYIYKVTRNHYYVTLAFLVLACSTWLCAWFSKNNTVIDE